MSSIFSLLLLYQFHLTIMSLTQSPVNNFLQRFLDYIGNYAYEYVISLPKRSMKVTIEYSSNNDDDNNDNNNIALELISHFIAGGYIRKRMRDTASIRKIDIRPLHHRMVLQRCHTMSNTMRVITYQ
jgi:hypothetical protein